MREPMTETMTINDAERQFGSLVRRVSRRETRVVVEEQGKAVAGIVSAEDLARLTQLDAQWDADWRVFDEIHAKNLDKTADEVEQDVAEAIAAVRAEARRKVGHRTAK